jgi:CHRD domain-containing protein/uncharacterized protein DUF3455
MCGRARGTSLALIPLNTSTVTFASGVGLSTGPATAVLPGNGGAVWAPHSRGQEGILMSFSTDHETPSARGKRRRWHYALGATAALAATATAIAVSQGSAHGAAASAAVKPASDLMALPVSNGAAFAAVASLEGRNEASVPGSDGGGGDRDGKAVELISVRGDRLSYTVDWWGTGTPTAAHIRTGASGVSGAIAVTLFAHARQDGSSQASGTVRVNDPALLNSLRTNPGGFYADLDTSQFPDGVARGQLHLLDRAAGSGSDALVQASVVRGKQIYACTKQSDGSFAFTQNNVSALLGGGIRHSFVTPNAGPPQWRAPDGSAVSGTLVTKNANGTGNIPELNLNTTQIGAAQGLLSRSVEVLRLNTVGGVAPTGSCNPAATPLVGVPYIADYVFVNGS